MNDTVKKPVHPAVIIIASVALLVLIIFYGVHTLGPSPSAVGFMNGKEMTAEDGAAFGRGMRGQGNTTPPSAGAPAAKARPPKS